MSCREFITLFLPDWLVFALPRRRAHECDLHVLSCRDCAAYARSYRLVTARLQRERLQCNDMPLPEQLVQAILQRAG